MRVLLQGKIDEFVPKVTGYIDEAKILTLEENANLEFSVDTGFTGGIALPENFLAQLNVKFIGYELFSLATGEIIDLPVYTGTTIVSNFQIETRFVPGDFLIGMELMSAISPRLVFDFERNLLTFEQD